MQHTIKHEIDWGHVALAVAVLAVLYVGYRVLGDRDREDGEQDAGEFGAEDARELFTD